MVNIYSGQFIAWGETEKTAQTLRIPVTDNKSKKTYPTPAICIYGIYMVIMLKDLVTLNTSGVVEKSVMVGVYKLGKEENLNRAR